MQGTSYIAIFFVLFGLLLGLAVGTSRLPSYSVMERPCDLPAIRCLLGQHFSK